MKKALSRQELQIMGLIWPLKTATVREVYEKMRRRRRIAYTTVMTVMGTLEEKGFLRRWQEGRAYVYKPTRSREQVTKRMVQDFVDRLFDGSADALLVHLVKERRLSQEDLAKIKQIIREAK